MLVKKILLVKPGLEGHDVGVKVLAHALKDNVFEVVHTGLRKSIEDIVSKAKEENADVNGLSVLSGKHQVLCERMKEVMKENNLKTHREARRNVPAQDVKAPEKTGTKKHSPQGKKLKS